MAAHELREAEQRKAAYAAQMQQRHAQQSAYGAPASGGGHLGPAHQLQPDQAQFSALAGLAQPHSGQAGYSQPAYSQGMASTQMQTHAHQPQQQQQTPAYSYNYATGQWEAQQQGQVQYAPQPQQMQEVTGAVSGIGQAQTYGQHAPDQLQAQSNAQGQTVQQYDGGQQQQQQPIQMQQAHVQQTANGWTFNYVTNQWESAPPPSQPPSLPQLAVGGGSSQQNAQTNFANFLAGASAQMQHAQHQYAPQQYGQQAAPAGNSQLTPQQPQAPSVQHGFGQRFHPYGQ